MIPRITRADLDLLGTEWGFRVDPGEAEAYLGLTDYVLSALDGLEEPEQTGDSPLEGRDPGGPPSPEDDPLNALVRRCSVRGAADGALAGLAVAVKDSVAVAGVPMTLGSRVFAGHIPSRDSVVTERLLGAGAQIVAITNMDSLAFSGGGDSSDYGPTLCPYDLERTSGGSSSGSAAALWYPGVDAGIGTDQGGSIRVPAAWCGVLGLKPSHGLVPYAGIAGIDATFDHAGPMARDVPTLARLLQVIAGPDPGDPASERAAPGDYVRAVAQAPDDLRGLRVGAVPEALGDGVGADPAVVAAFRDSLALLEQAGATVVDVSLPAHLEAGGIAFAGFVEGMTALLTGGGNGYHRAGRYSPDLALAVREGLDARGGELSPQVKLVLMVGTHLRRRYRGAVYARAQNLRPALRAAHDRAFEEVDLLAMPTTPGLPHPVAPGLPFPERVTRGWGVLANTYPTDMTGHPALSLPLAEAGGLPVGVMLVAPHGEDAQLLSVARTVEGAIGWRPGPPALSG